MKRLALILFLFACPAFGAITATSNVTCIQNTTTVTTCVGAAMTVSANDTIVIYISAGVTSWTTTPTDTCSEPWVHQPGASIKTGVSIIDAWTVSGATAGTCTITVTRAGTGGGKFGWVAENYAGVQKLGNVATTSGGSASTSATLAITTQDPNNFVVGGFSSGTKITLTGTTGTLRGQINASATLTIGLSDNTSASASSVANAVSFSAAAPFTAGAIELRSASTGRAATLGDQTQDVLMVGAANQTYTLPNSLLSPAWCAWVMPTGSTSNVYSIAVQSPSTLNGQSGTIAEPTYQMTRVCQDSSKNYWMRPPMVAGSNISITNSATATTFATTGVPVNIASGTAAMTTAAIAAISGSTVTCGSLVTVSATGVATTDVITPTANAAESSPNTALELRFWPTANNVNFEWCNPTASSQTPVAETINWKVVR